MLEARLRLLGRGGTLDRPTRALVDGAQRRAERAWLHEAGLPGRSWYRNLYAAPDETSGYAAWPLPGLQKAILEADAELAAQQIGLLDGVLGRRGAALDGVAAALDACVQTGESSGDAPR